MVTNELDQLNNRSLLSIPGWRATFLCVFSVILGIALVAQVAGLRWRTWFQVAEGQSFMRGVSAATYTLIAHIN